MDGPALAPIPNGDAPTIYIDGHRKPVYAGVPLPRGLIGKTGKILGCRALVLLHDVHGHVLLATTHRGDQHLTVGLPAILARYEQATGCPPFRCVVVDREGMSATWLRTMVAAGRTVITLLRSDQYQSLDSFHAVGSFQPILRDAHGRILREVAAAQFALKVPGESTPLPLWVALIRDHRWQVPQTRDPATTASSRWDSDMPWDGPQWWEERTGCDETAFIWEHLDTIARRIKGRLRSLLKTIPFAAIHRTHPVLEAVQFLQAIVVQGRSLTTVATSRLPTHCVPARLKRYLYTKAADGTTTLLHDRYEFYVYSALRAALESGELVCPQSLRFRSLDDDLISLDDWQLHRKTLIAETELPILQQPIAEHLAELEQALEAQFTAVNQRIAAGENPGVTITTRGKTRTWTVHTTAQLERPTHALFEQLPQVSMNAVLAAVDQECHFMAAFTHILGRGHHHTRDDRVIRACLVAWGTNLSLHRMGESSDLPAGTLIRASENYLRLETVLAANIIVCNAIAALPLFRAYDLGGVIHSSSDGQKFATDHDTLKAQHSPKYFALGKGIVSLGLVANHVPIAARLISAHEPESQWVFDLLYNNPTDIRPTIHSTDTHGANHVNFALLKVFGYEFAPRYANLQTKIATGLYGFQHPTHYGAKAFFRPIRKLNTDLIISQWDHLLRIFVSLSKKTMTQSVLVSKLSATKRRNRMLQALWEYDNIPASQYLLQYVDSEPVRQHVQRALNRGEQYHHLKRALTHGNTGKVHFRSDEEQELWNECSRLLVNVILYYNIRMLSDAVAIKEARGDTAGVAFLKDVSPVGWQHINTHGQYDFGAEPAVVPWEQCIATIGEYQSPETALSTEPPAPNDHTHSQKQMFAAPVRGILY